MGAVEKMELAEGVVLDSDRLVYLCVSLGESVTEALVTASIGDIARGVEGLDAVEHSHGQEEYLNALSRLASVARHIGLTSFAKVVMDITECIDAGDTVALSATKARLNRIAHKSEAAILHLEDMLVR